MKVSTRKSEAQLVAIDLSRRYLEDNKPSLPIPIYSTISGWIRSRNIDRLASCSHEFTDSYSSREVARVTMQIAAFFKKNEAFSGSDVQKQAAIKAFEAAERSCRRANRRLSHFFLQHGRLDPDLEMYMRRAERWISDLLGPFHTFLAELPRNIRVTSGASASESRLRSRPYLKVKPKIRANPSASPYLYALANYWGYKVKVIPQTVNRVEFVPKNWKTDRTIACEPEGNLPLQLAFDTYAKRRLRSRGIDLSDQSRNQQLAKEGSLSGKYATIDLSSASDTLAYSAVEWLLPLEWFEYLDNVRSPLYLDPVTNRVRRYAKFSSMGNGATFTLETLIFAAACHAVGAGRDFVVYGDDIVVPTELVPALTKLLRFLGFTVNLEKSYTEGSFRESCGANFWLGVDITPFYLRQWGSRKNLLCHNVNGLASVSLPEGRVWAYLRAMSAAENLPLVPFNCDSMSGIFVPARHAYNLGLLKKDVPGAKGEFNLSFSCFVTKTKYVDVYDSRTLFLWYLSAESRERSGGGELETSALERSRDPTSYKYVRKWVRWKVPAGETPAHLYWWADYIIRK